MTGMPTVSEMREAMRDLKWAFSASGIDDAGKFCCYEINGTAKAIPVAVAALLQIRQEDGDGDG